MTASPRVPHDASQEPRQPEVAGPAARVQWLGLLLAPVAFIAHFQGNYLLVMWVCGNDVGRAVIHIASAAACVLALAGTCLGLVAWRRAGDVPSDGDGVLPRTRLLGSLGIGLSSILALILLAQLVAGFVTPTCQ